MFCAMLISLDLERDLMTPLPHTEPRLDWITHPGGRRTQLQ